MKKMTIEELRSGIDFGRSVIKECESRNEECLRWVYERVIELQAELIDAIENGVK